MTIDFEQPNDGDNEEGGSNLFFILAVGLAGLIVLGLVAIGGVLILRNIREQQTLAQVTPSVTPTLAIVEQLPTATTALPTKTPVPPTLTGDALPTPTNTPVVQASSASAGGEQGGQAAGTPVAIASTPTSRPTNTPVPAGTPVGNNEVPDTGFGGFELALIAIGLGAVLFVTRRLRHAN